MTLDECYAANQGKALLIPGGGAGNEGQCVQWADTVLHDVYGFDYHWGNAIDWWNNPGELLNHFDKITDGSIQKGDFVIFNTLVGSSYGHIDVAMQDGSTANFQGADSNWGGNKTVHLVQHNNVAFVLGGLRLKEVIVAGITVVGAPASVSWDRGRIDVFARGSDNGLWHKFFDESGWHDWERIGGGIATAPSACSWSSQRLDVFATGVAGDLMHFWFSDNWHGPESLGQPRA